MTKKTFGLAFLLVAGIVATSGNSQAIEVQVGNRAQTMGMAFTAVADDPSAVYHNPAGLTQITKTEIDIGTTLQFTSLDYKDAGTGRNHPVDEIALVPTFFMSTDKAKPFSLGMGFYVPFGSKAEINADAASGIAYQKSELARYDFTLAAAYKFSEVFSLGVGFTTAYVTVKNDIPAGVGIRLDESATGFGFTGSAGAMFTPHKRFKAGLSFRGPMSVDLSGNATLAGVNSDFHTDLHLPGTVSLGLAFIPIDELTVSFDFDWTHWIFLDKIVRVYDNAALGTTTQQVNGKDAHDYRIGFEYRPFQKTNFRWGYSYQQAGWPKETIFPTELEYPLHVIAVGASHKFGERVRLDVGYELSLAVNRHVTASLNGYNGDYDGVRHIALVNTGIRF